MHPSLDAYNAQLSLAAWFHGSGGTQYCVDMLGYKDQLNGQNPKEETAQKFSRGEGRALLAATTYYVTAEMGLLVQAASRSAPDDALVLSDLPGSNGFSYFEDPFTIKMFTIDGLRDVRVHALRWEQTELLLQDGYMRPGIEIQAYVETADLPEFARAQTMGMNAIVPAWTAEDQWFCDLPWQGLTWDNPYPSDSNSVPEINPDKTAVRRVLLSLFRLTFQRRVVTIDRQPLDRATARRASRQGVEIPDGIQIIRLCREYRPAGQTEPSGTAVNWSYRWIVHGFWRNQWYPSLGTHKRIPISDYIKGPAHKPLLIRDRIYSLERPPKP
jgi:hypothetical protein